jgi:4a-hydroxytetrahydrobiopterin dehydratase
MKNPLLNTAQIQTELSKLPGWRHKDRKLWKQFQFTDFITAWGFLSQIALYAEAHNHHPEWSNVYNQVEISLFTHEAKGITQKDIELAQIIEQIPRQKQTSPTTLSI